MSTKPAAYIVICELSAEARAKLPGVKDPHGVTQLFRCKAPAMKTACAWVRSGLGPAFVNGAAIAA